MGICGRPSRNHSMSSTTSHRTRLVVAAAILASLSLGLYLGRVQSSASDSPSSLFRHLGNLRQPADLCGDHACLEFSNGLRMVDAHVKHITGIWDLVEGLGPAEVIRFHPTRQRSVQPDLRRSTEHSPRLASDMDYPYGVLTDDTSQVFIRRYVATPPVAVSVLMFLTSKDAEFHLQR